MTVYRIDLVQTVIEETSIYIEANNAADAADYAMAKVLDGDDVHWQFCDCKGDPEIIDVQPEPLPFTQEIAARAEPVS